jgi:hypothetical protein
MAQGKWIWMIGLALLATQQTAVWGEDRLSEQKDTSREVVTGTLIKLDLSSMKGLVQTDLGRPVFFEVTKPHLFQNLSLGDRVTVELDHHGQVNKVIGATVPEFLSPQPDETPAEAPSSVG